MLSTTVTIGDDEILTVTADSGSYGTVWLDGTSTQWSVGAKAPLRLSGPATYKIETVKGNVSHDVSSKDVAALAAALPAVTENIVSERIVTAAIVDGLQARRSKSTMALADKARLLAERAKAIPAKHSDRMDAISARLESADARATDAADRIEIAVVAQVEQSAVEMEDVANQLSNALGEAKNV
jgi:hypothetical protein